MKVFLSRHPKTLANRDGLILGAGESEPTEDGMNIFRRVVHHLQGEPVDLIVSSPLSRALAGAGIAASVFKRPVREEPGLRELSCGDYEGLPRKDLGLTNRPVRCDWTDRPPGGESYLDGERRLAPVIHRIKGGKPQQSVFIIGHSVINRVFLKVWLSMDWREAILLEHGFNELLVFSEKPVFEKIFC